MEEIKKVFKHSIITEIAILTYGLVFQVKEIYIGMFSGAVVSLLAFYLICMDVKKIVASGDGSYKRGIIGYLQRYAIYIIYLGVIAKFFGLSMIISSGLGLLNVKGNILLIALSDKILKIRDKHLR